MSIPSPGHRVAHVAEILENILLQLVDGATPASVFGPGYVSGIKTILISQSVSTAFCDTIAGSPTLQRALMLTPPSPEATLPRMNPLVDGFLQYCKGIQMHFNSRYLLETALAQGSPRRLWVDIYATPRITYSRPEIQPSWWNMHLCDQEYEVVTLRDRKRVSHSACNLNNATLGQIFDRVYEPEAPGTKAEVEVEAAVKVSQARSKVAKARSSQSRKTFAMQIQGRRNNSSAKKRFEGSVEPRRSAMIQALKIE